MAASRASCKRNASGSERWARPVRAWQERSGAGRDVGKRGRSQGRGRRPRRSRRRVGRSSWTRGRSGFRWSVWDWAFLARDWWRLIEALRRPSSNRDRSDPAHEAEGVHTVLRSNKTRDRCLKLATFAVFWSGSRRRSGRNVQIGMTGTRPGCWMYDWSCDKMGRSYGGATEKIRLSGQVSVLLMAHQSLASLIITMKKKDRTYPHLFLRM